MSLLGIDIGTSSCKGIVFDMDGRVLASATRSYPFERPGKTKMEKDPAVFSDAVFSLIRELSALAGDHPVEALSISSHGETTIPVDKHGAASGWAILNADNRAVEEAEWWAQSFGIKEIYSITGLPLHAMFSLNKILWLRKHQPEIYARTEKFLSVGDYMLVRMGLPPYTDYSLAGRTMGFDIRTRCWSDDILRHGGITGEKLGVPVPAGTIAGRLSRGIASRLGLREGVYVAVGGHDQPCGALGAGVIHAGEVFDSAGSYECVTAVSTKPANTEAALAASLNSYCHVVPDRYVTLAFFPAGLLSSWFVDELCYEDRVLASGENRDLFDWLQQRVGEVCPGPTGLCITPHIVGACTPHWDVRATGVMAGITPGITRHHLYKAVYEGIACELALNTAVLEVAAGPFGRMRISGGNARSAFTVQLRADITGKCIEVLETDEAVCLGAAMLAGISTGAYKDASDAVARVSRIRQTVLPDPVAGDDYRQQMERYALLYPSLQRFREAYA